MRSGVPTLLAPLSRGRDKCERSLFSYTPYLVTLLPTISIHHSILLFQCPHTRPNTRHNSRPSTQSSTPNPNSQPSAIPGRKRANGKTKSSDGSSSNKRAGIAVLVVFCLLILIFIAGWIAYAYTHPLSKSGMFLMQVMFFYGVKNETFLLQKKKVNFVTSFNFFFSVR